MKKEKRDKDGRIVPSLWQRFKSWRLGRKLRTGKVPRGRKLTSADAAKAIGTTFRGEMTEVWGFLSAKVLRADGTVEDVGLISVKKITQAFRDYIVDSLQDSATYPLDAFKYHASGTGSTAEANTETALVTEVGSRQAGTQTEGVSANIYQTVATLSYTAAHAITEHGIFSAASSGVLMDRSVFAAINVGAGDSIEFTYEATFQAEA
jgi:hypothetical protein